MDLDRIFLSKFLTLKYDKESSKIIRFATTFSNSGFMGYPVLQGLFGKIGIFYGKCLHYKTSRLHRIKDAISVPTQFQDPEKLSKQEYQCITYPS